MHNNILKYKKYKLNNLFLCIPATSCPNFSKIAVLHPFHTRVGRVHVRAS